MSLKVGGMFAGYGGLEMALHDVFGAEPAWFCEFEPPKEPGKKPPRQAASMILAHHWPDVPNHGDVTAVDWSAVEPVDIVAAGSPCPDLSGAGKRAGMRPGTRSGLWASVCDAVEIIRPRLVVWENVRGALNASAASASDLVDSSGPMGDWGRGHLRALGRVLGDLAELGYDAAWTGLRAADIGAPHGRFRVFVVAWPQSDPGALSWPQSDPGALLPTPVVNDMGAAYTPDEWDEWTTRLKASHGNGNGHGASLSVEALRLLPTPTAQVGENGGTQHPDKRRAGGHTPTIADVAEYLPRLLPTPRATDGTKGGPNQRGSSGDLMLPSAVQLLPTPRVKNNENRQSEGYGGEDGNFYGLLHNPERWGIYTPAIARWESIFRDAPAPTEPTGKGGAHRLAPRFVEWMQGLADGHVTGVPGITRNDKLKALGNGVVPQQGAEGVRRCIATARRWAVA